MRTTITTPMLLLAIACDPDGQNHDIEDRAALVDEDASGGETAPAPGSRTAVIVEDASEPAPVEAPADEFEADPDPVYATPQCGIGPYALQVNGCTWVRALATTDNRVEAVCSSGNPVAGSCWATSTTHKLFRSYMTEAAFDLVDNGQDFYDGYGWACEWDQNATTTNQHIAMALCCGNFAAPLCV